jgi:diacylglycerol kinase family enzyme
VKQVLIFVNPIAGRGRGRDFASKIAQSVENRGVRAQVFEKPAVFVDPKLFPAPDEILAAVAIGGDGTIRAAAQKLLETFGNDPTRVPPIAVVPLGTANLMAKHLRLHWKMRSIGEEVAEAIHKGHAVTLDAARANGLLFLLMAGVGLDASVVHELDRVRRGPISMASYTLPLLWSLRQYDYPPLRVEVDGRCVADSIPSLVFVGNVKEYGTGFPILMRARSNDQQLDVCVLPCASAAQAMRWAILVTTADHMQEDGVVYTKGRRVRIESPKPVPVQIDGEASGHTPLDIELLPKGLRFIVQHRDE